jgi:hypothetical protein
MAMLGNSSAGLAQRADSALERLNEVMDLILEALDTRVEELCITDQANEPGLQKDFPTPGSQRWIINRLATGGNFAIGEADSDVLQANSNRIGGTIVNKGSKPVLLTLAPAAAAKSQDGLAEIWLAQEGGSWDFRLGNMLWCGSISAKAEGGETALKVVEI